METRDALALAVEKGLDLVEINPRVRPPVCKLIDYGKFKYEEKKKKREARARQTTVETKEMKFRPKTDEHDLDFKSKHIRRFLEEGNKCRLVVQFRGRERAHPRVGRELLLSIAAQMADIAEISQPPQQMENGRMSLLLSPRVGVIRRAEATG